MRIVQEFVSADGFAADVNGEFGFAGVVSDWSALDADQMHLLDGVRTILLGRKTYELFIEYWPIADHALAKPINTTPKAVLSRSLDTAAWGHWPAPTVQRGPLPDVIGRITGAANPGHVLVWGSLALTKSLLRQGLVDELRLIVCPVFLGAGIGVAPPDLGQTPLKLVDTKAYSNGAVSLTYRTLPQ